MLRVIEDGKLVHTARVVVGKPDKQTPVFSNEMQEIVFNPYWNVPNSIKTEEIRPYPPRGRRLVRRRRLEHCRARAPQSPHQYRRQGSRSRRRSTGTASTSAASTSISRLDPTTCSATSNSCFPTSTTSTCTTPRRNSCSPRPVRAESHGCMRVQNPDQLAARPAQAGPGLERRRGSPPPSRVGHDQHIALQQKIPVYITYFTLRVNDDGSISTFGDLYGHDSPHGRGSQALRRPDRNSGKVTLTLPVLISRCQ